MEQVFLIGGAVGWGLLRFYAKLVMISLSLEFKFKLLTEKTGSPLEAGENEFRVQFRVRSYFESEIDFLAPKNRKRSEHFNPF